MPCIRSLIVFLSAVLVTTATKADTPFFWDDFDRESLADGDLHWETFSFSGAGEFYLEDGSLILRPHGAWDRTDAFIRIAPVGDFSIRTQIKFGGDQILDGRQAFGSWFTNAPVPGAPGISYWGGVLANGSVYIGGSETNNDSEFILDPNQIYQRDIHLQFDAIGDRIAMSAWFDGEEKPDDPQIWKDREQFAPTAVAISYNTRGAPGDHLGIVRHFAVVPEPTSGLLLAIGLVVGIAHLRHRRP
jgi:hypothetical protein